VVEDLNSTKHQKAPPVGGPDPADGKEPVRMKFMGLPSKGEGPVLFSRGGGAELWGGVVAYEGVWGYNPEPLLKTSPLFLHEDRFAV